MKPQIPVFCWEPDLPGDRRQTLHCARPGTGTGSGCLALADQFCAGRVKLQRRPLVPATHLSVYDVCDVAGGSAGASGRARSRSGKDPSRSFLACFTQLITARRPALQVHLQALDTLLGRSGAIFHSPPPSNSHLPETARLLGKTIKPDTTCQDLEKIL